MATFDPQYWAPVPFHFWTMVFFIFGSMVGSFLNVVIYRLPREESLVTPPSHCPHCGNRIPWRLNIPLFSWVWLRGKCAFCAAPISARYVGVELLTALLFTASWLSFGGTSAWLALTCCVLLAGLVAATFIDFEHFIIPDQITLGGVGVGLVCSFLVPPLHGTESSLVSARTGAIGAVAGAGIVYAFLRAGKLLFGRQRFPVEPGSRVYFGEDRLTLPGHEIPYEEVFYRPSDKVILHATRLELVDRSYANVPVVLTRAKLRIGEDEFNTEEVPCFEVETDALSIPREAMGLGDVKFMAAIGAFVGWEGVLFSLTASAMIGAVVGVTLIAMGKRERSSLIPYGPYIALAAALWVFFGPALLRWWLPPM